MTVRAAPWLLALVFGCANAKHADPDGHTQPQKDAPEEDIDAHVNGIDAPPPDASNPCAFTGVLATWDFAGAAGSQLSTPVKTTGGNATAGPITRATGLTAVAGATSINSSGWPTAATLDPAKYYTMTLTPPTGCTLSLTSASIDAKASGTGPAMVALGTSADAYAQTTALTQNTVNTPALAVSGASSPVEVRIYGWAATAAAGTFRLQNTLTISGSVQ
jgi:hypothetical protein